MNYIILLTHVGMSVEQYTSDGLLSKLEGVDAVLDGLLINLQCGN